MKVLILVNGAPYGTATPAEAFRTISGLAGMDVDTTCVLVEDGVYVALKDQNPETIDMQNLAKAYEMLKDFNARVYILKESMEERGIKEDELIQHDGIIDRAKLRELILERHCIISFVSGG